MRIVVTGATGNVGRPLVAELVAAGAEVRAVSRRVASAGLPAEVKVFERAADAIPGATAMFLNSRALGEEMASAVKEARKQGVVRLVALSAINADDDFSRQPSRFRGDRNREAEQLAVESGLDWISLRPSVFVTNFAGMWAGQIAAGDTVYGPFANASSAPIVESDIAAVAARAFLSDAFVGQRLALTGPESLTNAQMVGIIADLVDRPLQYQEIPVQQVRERFNGLGFPAGFGDAYVAMLERTVDSSAEVTDAIGQILGRPAASFGDWVAEHRGLFANGQGGQSNV